jgi:exopolysaccharide biosynthesis predicted pyruvyltransferase EpsI
MPSAAFEKVFLPLRHMNIGFVVTHGNTGDHLLQEASRQLFQDFGIVYRSVNTRETPNAFVPEVCEWADEFVVCGGGNMGEKYRSPRKVREKIRSYHKPVTILPQTFTNSREDYPYKKVWVRERKSLEFREDAELAPDLALGYSLSMNIPEPCEEIGLFVRTDLEQTASYQLLSLGDPATMCTSLEEYFSLASRYQKICTNRLHFAIVGLILGREVVLLPNSYFKNRELWLAWLQELGCVYKERLSALETARCAAARVSAAVNRRRRRAR